MWAVIPPLPSQPVVDLVPDQPSRVIQYGWPSDFNQILGNYRISQIPSSGQDITLTSAIQNIHAVHVMARNDRFTDFSICLGPRYRFTLKSYVNLDPIHPFLGVDVRYMRATIEDGGSAVATANLPNIPYPNRFVYPTASGLVVCFGYVFDGPQLKAYAHVSSHRVTQNASLQFGVVPSCGSGTASMIANVDAGDALAGSMSLIVRENSLAPDGNPFDPTGLGGLEFFSMACHVGPFLSTSPHMQERFADKLSRAGTRVASLRSRATNFSQPMAAGGALISAATNNNQGVADIDCGGHPEFSASSRFAVSLAGQPEPDVAYVASSNETRGNCGFTQQHLTNLSQVTVTANVNFFPDFYGASPASFTKTIPSDAYGNNEYAGVANASGETDLLGLTWDSVAVQCRITGYENVDDYAATPIQNVLVRFVLRIEVSIFPINGGNKITIPAFPVGASASKNLTEAEAEDFFNGGTVSLADGAITVTPAG